MIGLGFNAFIHDTAAALIIDGRTVAFVEEERLTREKHTTAFPKKSVQFCLNQAGITISDLDYVAFYWDPFAGFFKRAAQTIRNFPRSITPFFGHQLQNFKNMRTVERIFRETFGYSGEFHFVNHYLAHAAHAAFRSGFDQATILVVDGNGEIATTWLGELTREGRLVKRHEVFYPHSIGLVWCSVTEYLGFKQNHDEGKVMGLSAYGDECLAEPFADIFKYKGDGDFEVDLSYFDYHQDRKNWFSQKFVDVFGAPRSVGGQLSMRQQSVAEALQANTEKILLQMVADLVKMTGIRDLAYTGGVALNCVANGRIVKSGLVDNLFIPPAANDAGAALGAALYVHHVKYGKRDYHREESVYKGPEYSLERMEKALAETGLNFRKSDEICREAADKIAQGRIVGWYQGRLEAGPRALGNRSILADPRSDRMKDHLNARVKHREWFRPFGPSVLDYRAEDLFETGGTDSPHMLLAFKVRPKWQGRIPGVEHVDHTARIQTVSREQNQRYFDLISHFDRLTGVPAIINTSFNVMGEPIVATPENAVACFMSTGIDVLCLGDFICEKAK